MDIIIETPKGSREKFKYDEEHRLFRLHKTLPAGLVFIFDFGFIPGTKGEDGDPIDIMVLSEFTSFPGCVMDCRIIGCIQAEQSEGDKMIRNDRFLGVPEQSAVFENVISIEDTPPTLIMEMEDFLSTYMQKEGKDFRLLGKLDAADAFSLLKKTKARALNF
ncbi:MAG: inorganic diphosphatase [Chitinophagaceae bacterium]